MNEATLRLVPSLMEHVGEVISSVQNLVDAVKAEVDKNEDLIEVSETSEALDNLSYGLQEAVTAAEDIGYAVDNDIQYLEDLADEAAAEAAEAEEATHVMDEDFGHYVPVVAVVAPAQPAPMCHCGCSQPVQAVQPSPQQWVLDEETGTYRPAR